MSQEPAGWSPDNADPNLVRDWDGSARTERTAPATAVNVSSGQAYRASNSRDPRSRQRALGWTGCPKVLAGIGAVLAFFIFVGCAATPSESPSESEKLARVAEDKAKAEQAARGAAAEKARKATEAAALAKRQAAKAVAAKKARRAKAVAEKRRQAAESKAAKKAAQQAAQEDVYYANCTEVENAGAAPIYEGDPGYSADLDRDQDGSACDQ